VADPAQRVIRRLAAEPYTLRSLLETAGRYLRPDRAVLVGIDAPIGAPRSLLAATAAFFGLPPTANFLDWLLRAVEQPGFFDRATSPDEWSPVRPFFRVPAGAGGLGEWMRAMQDEEVEPYRDVDLKTAAKSLFVLSGIPGSVGSSVRDIWTALAEVLRDRPPALRVWPFDQPEPDPGAPAIVLAEIYPRALYAAALQTEAAANRARLALAKRDEGCREAALDGLLGQAWVREHGVRFEDVDAAAGSEDACDALLSAAGALRCVLEGTPLGWSGAHPFEGGILGLDSVNLALRERAFQWDRERTRYGK